MTSRSPTWSRPRARRVRPQRDPARRARDARPDGAARGVRRAAAAQRRPDRRLAAHDRADRRPHRDARRARRRRALGLLQHLLHPGPRRRRGRRRPERHRRRPAGRAGLRLEGRDAGGVLVVHRADAHLARRRRPEHAARRRRRRHPADPHGHRVRDGRRRAEPRPRTTPRSTRVILDLLRRSVADDPTKYTRMGAGIKGVTEETTTGVHRLYEFAAAGTPAVPGDQRQRLGDQEQVRQQVRHPPLADRRHQPRHRRPDRRQGRGRARLRRRRQGLRGVAARPGRPRHRHRDRPDLRAAGGDGRLPGR